MSEVTTREIADIVAEILTRIFDRIALVEWGGKSLHAKIEALLDAQKETAAMLSDDLKALGTKVDQVISLVKTIEDNDAAVQADDTAKTNALATLQTAFDEYKAAHPDDPDVAANEATVQTILGKLSDLLPAPAAPPVADPVPAPVVTPDPVVPDPVTPDPAPVAVPVAPDPAPETPVAVETPAPVVNPPVVDAAPAPVIPETDPAMPGV